MKMTLNGTVIDKKEVGAKEYKRLNTIQWLYLTLKYPHFNDCHNDGLKSYELYLRSLAGDKIAKKEYKEYKNEQFARLLDSGISN